jgi:hypothetical protein
MCIRLCGISVLPLTLCVLLGCQVERQEKKQKPLADQEKKQKPQNSIESLFEGLPADLRKNVKGNQVRIDRVNDWLKNHVNGKRKTIEIRVPAGINPLRRLNKTYTVYISVDRTKASVKALGEEWPLELIRKVDAPKVVRINKDKAKWKDPKDPGNLLFVVIQASFEDVSPADAEKMAELKEVTIQGKVQKAVIDKLAPSRVGILLILDDVRLEGKELTPSSTAAKK